jgi:hypothetical protein
LKDKEFTKILLKKVYNCEQYEVFHCLQKLYAKYPEDVEKARKVFFDTYRYSHNVWLERVMRQNGVEVENCAFEFKKVSFKHQFDREWSSEVNHMRNDHFAILGSIIEFSKPNMGFLPTDPMDVEGDLKSYKWSLKLPFLEGVSEEMFFLLS